MREYMELGPVPCDEECVQVKTGENYHSEMREEMGKYVELLYKRFPQVQEYGCGFGIKMFPHDFGSYGEVCICYNDADAKAQQFAMFVESNLPMKWADVEVLTTEIKEKVVCSLCGDLFDKDEVNPDGECSDCSAFSSDEERKSEYQKEGIR